MAIFPYLLGISVKVRDWCVFIVLVGQERKILLAASDTKFRRSHQVKNKLLLQWTQRISIPRVPIDRPF
jgi:hypothetical protein